MTTQEIAHAYYQLAAQNKWQEIQETLHADEIICQEPDHAASRGVPVTVKGKAALKAKTLARQQMIDTIHEQYCSEPLVAGNFFAVVLKRDITLKGRPRTHLEEVGLFQVADGKITLEQFFY